MNGFEIAALIAAIAFAGLMYFLIRLVQQANRVVKNVEKTVEEANREVEGLLVKSNELLADVNQKVATIDPLFTAVADLSESVSDLNDASRNLVSHVGAIGKTTAQTAIVGRVGQLAAKYMRKNKTQTNETEE